MLTISRRKSPNFSERFAATPRYIVLHYTGMRNAAEALSRLCDPASQVSAHYVIDEKGAVAQLVDEKMRAWHAGKSSWRGITDMNSASIGIELVNPGHEFGYRPFPSEQIAALKELIPVIAARHNMAPESCLVGHSDIAPGRKMDPGELFPWQEMAQIGFGIWPVPEGRDFAPASDVELADMLSVLGYDVSDAPQAIAAFQRRYCPENITGTVDGDTAAKARALNRKMSYQQDEV
jgi:N-acetylmuramoyl-L-alanine amidase